MFFYDFDITILSYLINYIFQVFCILEFLHYQGPPPIILILLVLFYAIVLLANFSSYPLDFSSSETGYRYRVHVDIRPTLVGHVISLLLYGFFGESGLLLHVKMSSR